MLSHSLARRSRVGLVARRSRSPFSRPALVKGRWRVACGSCRVATGSLAHLAVDTDTDTGGNEACGVWNGRGRNDEVERLHQPH